MNSPPTDAERESMIHLLEDLRRKVATGEIGGLVLASIRSNGTFVLTSYGMGPKAEGILALEEKVAELKTLFLRANQRPYDGRPEIGIVTDPGANDEERGDRG